MSLQIIIEVSVPDSFGEDSKAQNKVSITLYSGSPPQPFCLQGPV